MRRISSDCNAFACYSLCLSGVILYVFKWIIAFAIQNDEWKLINCFEVKRKKWANIVEMFNQSTTRRNQKRRTKKKISKEKLNTEKQRILLYRNWLAESVLKPLEILWTMLEMCLLSCHANIFHSLNWFLLMYFYQMLLGNFGKNALKSFQQTQQPCAIS